jgi:LysM repeat protein
VSYSSMENGKWDITSLSVRTTQRRPSDHEVTQAEVDISFYRSTGGATGLGPVSGGVGKGGKGDGKTSKVNYTVKQGDTLHSIATKELKDASKWKDIAKWNDIKDPKKDKKMKAGGKLTLFVPVKKKGK